MSRLTLDYNNMLDLHLSDGGVDASRLEGDLGDRFREVHAGVETARQAGEIGFFDLPYSSDTANAIQEVADSFGQWFENVVVLGIGGSALGTRMLRDALLGPLWNEGSGERREHYPRLYVVENVDPDSMASILDRLDLRRTLFNVVSKSGATAETMAQYLVASERVATAVGEETARGHFLFTTDPHSGALRRLADAHGIPSLPVPPNVGGRFSVLSAVGLLPAAIAGIDVTGLLQGAAEMERRCRAHDLEKNPAGMLATLLHRAHVEDGEGIHVLMPYSDRLRSFGLWFQQLWAESLGKGTNLDGEAVETGPTPLPALGATDQHSLLQLLMEGPRDKVVCFISVETSEDPVAIPDLHPGLPTLAYLGGHTLRELIDAERAASAEALRRQSRPNLTIRVPVITAETVGQLLMMFEIATVYAGALYGVNPLDQPGVELSKTLAYGLLGREGHDPPVLEEGEERWRM